MSRFAESAAAVNRVVTQHIFSFSLQNVKSEVGQDPGGLSPPSESRLMQRRRVEAGSRSLKLRSCAPRSKVFMCERIVSLRLFLGWINCGYYCSFTNLLMFGMKLLLILIIMDFEILLLI